MTIRELIPVLDARVLCGEDKLDQEVKSACGSDLPATTRNSSRLSNLVESLPSVSRIGRISAKRFLSLPPSIAAAAASTACSQPLSVLISPLCATMRIGCARSQLGNVLVE